MPEAERILQEYADEYGAKVRKDVKEKGMYKLSLRYLTYSVRMSKEDDHIALQNQTDDGGYTDGAEGPFTEETLNEVNEVIDVIDATENGG